VFIKKRISLGHEVKAVPVPPLPRCTMASRPDKRWARRRPVMECRRGDMRARYSLIRSRRVSCHIDDGVSQVMRMGHGRHQRTSSAFPGTEEPCSAPSALFRIAMKPSTMSITSRSCVGLISLGPSPGLVSNDNNSRLNNLAVVRTSHSPAARGVSSCDASNQ